MRRTSKLKSEGNGLTGTLFPPASSWKCPTEYPNLSGVTKLAIDIESRDPDLNTRGPGFIRGDAHVAGISISTDDRSWYFPLAHLGGGNMDRGNTIWWLNDVLSDPDRWVVGANLCYELEGLASLGISVEGRLLDIQLIEALIDEERDDGYSLDDLCRLYLGTNKDERLLREAAVAYGVHPKHELWKLPSQYVGPYAEYDSACCLKILEKQMARVKKDQLEQIVELEMKLIPVLHAMRQRGIPIDLEHAEKLSKRLVEEEATLQLKMIREYGTDLNVNSGDQIGKVCDKLGIKYPRTTYGKPSFEAKWLEEHEHPFIELVLETRQINSLRSKFIDNWIFKNHVNGRIHPQWKQLMSDEGGTRTGRMAAANPNPQQIPAGKRRNGTPNPIGKEIRSLFRSDSGLWCKIDYSQQEPRILTHFASVCKMGGAELAAMAYRNNPDMDFYIFMMEAAGIERRPAKDMYLGRCYGMGKNKLAAKLNKTLEEAEKILADFDEKVPFVKEIADKCSHLAQNRGFIRTLCGRKRHFNYYEPVDSFHRREEAKRLGKSPPDLRPVYGLAAAEQKWPGGRYQRSETHKALNALIQGSAADMMKSGLIKGFYEDGRVPYITVHDEVGGSVEDQDDANRWKKTMETCVEMCVPIKGDMNVGESWK